MTKEEFAKASFKKGDMIVMYGEEYPILSIDFEKGRFRTRLKSDPVKGVLQWISIEWVELLINKKMVELLINKKIKNGNKK